MVGGYLAVDIGVLGVLFFFFLVFILYNRRECFGHQSMELERFFFPPPSGPEGEGGGGMLELLQLSTI